MSNKTVTLSRDDIFILTVVLNEFNKLMPDELKRGEKIDNESLTSLFEKVNDLLPRLADIYDAMGDNHLEQAVFTLTNKREGK